MRKVISIVLFAALTINTTIAKADFVFGEPQSLGPVINSPSSDYGPCVSADGLELYFCSERAGGFGAADIWVSKRQSVNDPWESPVNIGSTVNSPSSESYPTLSSDGLTLYFSDAYTGTARPGGLGGGDIWMATRPNRNTSWGEPVNMGIPINSNDLDMSPSISEDGLTLVFNSRNRTGGIGSWDLWISTRSDVQDPWDQPVNLGPSVNSGNWEGEGCLSADGLIVLFGSGRTGIVGGYDMWMSTRKSLVGSWTAAVNLGPVVNSSSDDGTPRLSPDMKTLYFNSNRPGSVGSYDLFEAPIIPVIDLNGDGIVDSADMCIIVDNWGTNNSFCDIGPTPFGDGIVDAQDLIALSEYLFEELDDPTLTAHWALDETEGNIASDSVNDNHGNLYGDPLWQPDNGIINGALLFDGNDDYIEANSILSPANGQFSVIAWIKGGGPGQVVLSQIGGVNWLCSDSTEGNLMTEVKAPGRSGKPLQSQTNITDDEWHRIGFVWDGSNRTLYVDGVAVAEDSQENLEGSEDGMYIGTGKNMEQGTFWSGLIDDVRIYNRAVRP